MTNKTLPSDLLEQLTTADKRAGLPVGTMQAILQQETGGNTKYLEDPTAYHYGLNAEGKRIAGHTGKVSTAFGPFGILESTARDPGFGVAPLKDKSLGEQIRFAADYLGARVKRDGLEKGLAGYGEGTKYGQQVADRIKGGVVAPLASDKKSDGVMPSAVPISPPTQDDSYVEPVMANQGPVFPMEVPTYTLPQIVEWEALKQALPEAPPVAALQTYGQGDSSSYASLLGSLSSLAQPDFAPVKPMRIKA